MPIMFAAEKTFLEFRELALKTGVKMKTRTVLRITSLKESNFLGLNSQHSDALLDTPKF